MFSGLGSWLTAESDAEHASPIKRGRWLSDSILCDPVPPPPAGLKVEPIQPGADGKGIRDALEAHRKNPLCAKCHSRLDVLGIGFEVFDGVGRERKEPGLDSLGELPNGKTFEGAAQFASGIEESTFVSCLTRKLYSYALGRPIHAVDEQRLTELGDNATKGTLTLAQMIEAVVTNPSFRLSNSEKEEGKVTRRRSAALSRRRWLRGAGGTLLALPMLEFFEITRATAKKRERPATARLLSSQRASP